ncbi:glucose PTS transporter subunit IIA [Cellulomonas sp. SLBN-39]|uniref:glucose PTS transporter subunit IIA n=1 Tax=Cellulomonas sp. SLBN-39 TaxID=2768446 RepID=UPI00114DD08F|nr:glucose PTS transporter subunit IIA [Cellulomonas sp. SLBN-39]TQL03134.1 PTS system IIA component (Glc family) /PTS system IIB component (Glc family) /PTS system IIC component (Glc family) [Cellulomonas sp. SLBN-39]
MTSATTRDRAEEIVAAVGGPANVLSLTHCATRLRFELKDASVVDRATLEKVPGVMGAVPQSGDRYQVVVGGAVQSVYTQIVNLPSMKGVGAAGQSDADVKAAARSKARGKVAWLDAFFEYLSDSFRPLLGVLLGASLIIAFTAVLDALGVVDFRAADKPAGWVFVDAMWRSVFYFLPIMVAYNAAKKLEIDPWVGATVMGALMTPNFISLSDPTAFAGTVCTTNATLGTDSCVADVFGLPLQLNDYGGQVFVPLIMVAVLALVYKMLKRIFPENIQMVFVPFFSMVVMIPVTAFLIGPLGIWLGSGLGSGLAWLNGNAPIAFAIIIPLLYPFLVPLGLHWPLNALMLVNIGTLGYDFIQGPMGAWNFACFGATAGVLFLAWRDKDVQMRQTATGALAAGLLGGISEPSLYGIHLRYKRIYPRMLVGCLTGGLIIGIFGGVNTSIFAFTSLLTIPVFEPMALYAIAVAAAFAVSMVLVIVSDYRTAEQKAEALEARRQAEADLALEASAGAPAPTPPADAAPTATLLAPLAGTLVPLAEVKDAVFSSKALGDGVGVVPADDATTLDVLAPVTGTLITLPDSRHAYGIKTDDAVEVLVHVGIDTVNMAGDGFTSAVTKGDRVTAGEVLGTVDVAAVRAAGYDTTTLVTVINTRSLAGVTPRPAGPVVPGDAVVDVVP